MMLALNVERDPTRTARLRAEYGEACAKRMRKLKGAIRQAVVDNQVLELAPRGTLGLLSNAEIPNRYDFPSDPVGKAQAFLDWLREMADAGVLEISQMEGRRVVQHGAWQDTYVRAAYGKGMARADALMRSPAARAWAKANGINIGFDLDLPESAIGLAFNQPMHADALAMLFTRNFNELRGITEAMSTAIGRALAEGMARGLGAKEMAKLITQQVDGVGMRRALLLARTEVIRAFNEAALNRYEEYGVRDVVGQVELSTAGDHRVCSICAGLAGQAMPVQQARGLIPVHPNCRCAWLPVVGAA